MSRFEDLKKKAREEEEITPDWDDGVPLCTRDVYPACRNFDGKRCAVMGMQPSHMCLPMVKRLVEEVAD